MKFILIVLTVLVVHSKDNPATAMEIDFQPPQLVDGVVPNYPQPEISNPREALKTTVSSDSGLVKFMFMVDIAGQPTEIMKVWSSNPKFEGEALLALEKFKYKPATENDKIIEGRGMATTKFVFKNSDLKNGDVRTRSLGGSSSRNSLPNGFLSYNKQLNKEIEKKEMNEERVDYLLKKMGSLKHQKFYSLSYLSWARFQVAQKRNNRDRQISSLIQLLDFDSELAEEYKIVTGEKGQAIKAILMKLLIESGRYMEAITQYEILNEENSELQSMFGGYIDKIQNLRSGSKVLEQELTIGGDGYVHLNLFKRSFLIDQVEGALQSIKLRCERKFKQLRFQPNMQVALPKEWGECNLQVIGEQKTTFALLQQ